MKTPMLATLTILLLFLSAESFAISTEAKTPPEAPAFGSDSDPDFYSFPALGISLGAGTALGFAQSEADKRYHYWAGYGIATVSTWSLNRAGLPKLWSSVSGLALGVLAGWAKEEYDRSRGKPFDQGDWNATAFGAASGVAILNIPW